jgi:hypothetical protein
MSIDPDWEEFTRRRFRQLELAEQHAEQRQARALARAEADADMEDAVYLDLQEAQARRDGHAFDRSAARRRLRDSPGRQDRVHARYVDYLLAED